jgi:hypothetical protein
MPLSTPKRDSIPLVLENPVKIGNFLQQADAVDFYNMFTTSILVGEPILLFDKVGISKIVVPGNTVGTVNFGAWMHFLLDPALAANIHQGDKVYFDYDLAVADVSPGYATQVEPTNGVLLGHATILHGKDLVLGTGSKPIAATTNDKYVAVRMHTDTLVDTVNVFGTVPDFVAGS